MKKWVKILIGVVVVILLIFLIIEIIKQEKRYQHFKVIKLETKNSVSNRTDIDYLDTIVHVGLSKLGIKNTYVIIYPITEDIKQLFSNDLKLEAHIRGFNGQYIIWIDKLSRQENITVLSHELIHLNQYQTKKLIYIDDTVIWNGERVDLTNIPYQDRPWEKEAFDKEFGLEREIKKELFE
jgi:hypothetical protein